MRQYKKLLRLDSQDAKLQLEIADAHRRWGQIKEALETYERIAVQYSEEGFDARAVAVYKQILNLAPTHNESYAKLAELYERMGLVGEALKSLQVAADALNKKGKRVEALGLLRRMASIDPANTTSRIKVANLLREEGLESEAVVEFEALAVSLESEQNFEGATAACRSVLEIDADHAGSSLRLARVLVAQKRFREAVEPARHGIELDSDAPEHYELLAEALNGAGLEVELPDVYTRLAELHMRRGDEDRAREIRQRYLDPADLDLGVEMEAEVDGDLPSILEPAGSVELSDDLEEAAIDLPSLRDAETTGATMPTETTGLDLPEVDLEQLVGEAGALQGAGKHAQALERLEEVLDIEAGYLPALERLGELHAAMGASELALEAWQRAAKSAHEAGDEARFELLQARVGALKRTAGTSGGDAFPVDAGDPGSLAGAVAIEIDVEGEVPFVEPEGAALGEPDVWGEAQSLASDAGPGFSEELEEADFYFRQGLHSESEAIYRRILATDPDHATAVSRLAELGALEQESGSEAPEPIEAQELPGAESPAVEAGGFDLAAELSDVLDDSFSEVAAQSGTDDGFATVFDAFKKGVGETLGDGDHQAHYDLGIAYKEMGLYSD
ncbi:MAG: tetratricopeptide repeat protein, partial [Myxococcota bacterium]